MPSYQMSKIYGLTGGIAAGKSTVLELFKEHGYMVYDADTVARKVVQPASIGLKEIVAEFGDKVLQADGSLNRSKLAAIVFSDELQLQKLNQITRPLIKDEILKIITEVKNSSQTITTIFEIQLLFEGHYQEYFDGVISLYVEPQTQLQRLMKRNKLTEKVAWERINSQMSMNEKKSRADFVIDNSGDLTQLAYEFDKLITQL
ncbi:dephospho-CoA kinase [Companilactobacillus kimchiensis]|uniref:Dephospho-CoA kinase n=2 Tax=Companilactobacillus kimchiensis TaxID=993692 RepID=A0A0R2LN42_9LACO|nr:dephospho-CoA kinase [Companilactobacillus kimchiensis]